MNEDLRQWFNPNHPKGGWKRIDSKGNVVGPCAREPGEPKPKCMSNEKRAKLSKKERAAAVRAKREHDPNPERKGAPIMVSNFGKGKITEENIPDNKELWAKAISLAKSKFDVYPCVPMDSMAITKSGPAYRDQLKIGDEILTYNIKEDKLEWKPIVNLHHFEDAPLVEMKKSTGFKIRCTPNHKWVVQHGIDGDDKFVNTELLETKDIMNKKNHKRLICCSTLEDSTSSSDLGEWSKTDSWTEKVLSMSRDQREVYLASAIVYDGHDCGVSTKISGRHTMGFSQKNEDHFWSAILAAYLNGYHVSYSDKSVGDMRSATIIRNKKHHSTQNVVFTTVENESVWCPETENNTWVMVQNGWITITGNSAYANGWAAKWYKKRGGTWHTGTKNESLQFSDFLQIDEVSPPDYKLTKFTHRPDIRSDFRKRYGDNWQAVLYGKAWKNFKLKKERGEVRKPSAKQKERLVAMKAQDVGEAADAKPYKGFDPEKNHPEGGLKPSYAKKLGIRSGIETKREAERKGGFGKLSAKTQKRRASFCARMKGMKKHNTSPEVAADPNSKINASLRVWGCN